MRPSVDIPGGSGCPAFRFDLARTNIFLGINGSGKSRLLYEIESHIASTHQVVRAKGATIPRVGAIASGSILPKEIEADWRSSFKQSKQVVLRNNKGSEPSDFDLMLRSVASERSRYQLEFQRASTAYVRGHGEKPIDEESPIHEIVREFNEIFPHVELAADESTTGDDIQSTVIKLSSSRFGEPYDPTSFSDGEKRVLNSLVHRHVLNDNENLVFAVDEPELHLDPQLACRFWASMEQRFPDATFLYATHSLDFAMRPEVEKTWVIGRHGATELTGHELSSPENQIQFLGAAKSILACGSGLITEGGGSSFDSQFYPWLLGDRSIAIEARRSRSEVIKATQDAMIWPKSLPKFCVPGFSVLGVVDRDYNAIAKEDDLANSGCISLDLHDAEAYLCHPDLVIRLAEEMNCEKIPGRIEITDTIVSFARANILRACQATASRNTGVSVSREVQQDLKSKEDLISALIIKAGAEAEKLSKEITDTVNHTHSAICTACETKDFLTLLKHVLGKQLLVDIAKSIFDVTKHQIMRDVKRNLNPREFEHTRQLRDRLLERLKASEKRNETADAA